MKTKNVKLFVLCLIFSGFSLEISAQNHLDALIKKCETHKSVDMEVVKSKRKTEKDVEPKTVNIRITNDKKLVNEFLDAFKKDADNAEQVMFKKRKEDNKINYYQCRFENQTYTMVIKEEGNANITVGNAWGFRFSFDDFQSRQKEREEQQKERIKHQKEREKQQLSQQKEREKRHQKRMKQHQERMKQYKLNKLDSIVLQNNIIADSLILKSSAYFNYINWDSITSIFGKNMDSLAFKLNLGWDEILERYDFE
jgi:hypothetical protein